MKLPLVILILGTAVLAGCDTANPGVPASQRTNPDKVAVLKTRPDTPYDELGKVSASETYVPEGGRASALMGNGGDVIADLREKAGDLGADAVIVVSKDIIPPIDAGQSTKIFASGIAIKFKKASVAAAPP